MQTETKTKLAFLILLTGFLVLMTVQANEEDISQTYPMTERTEDKPLPEFKDVPNAEEYEDDINEPYLGNFEEEAPVAISDDESEESPSPDILPVDE